MVPHSVLIPTRLALRIDRSMDGIMSQVRGEDEAMEVDEEGRDVEGEEDDNDKDGKGEEEEEDMPDDLNLDNTQEVRDLYHR